MSSPDPSTAGGATVRRLRIGELELDAGTGELIGPGGTERLDPKVLAVLLLLAHHAGSVVSREAFLDSIWAGMVVSDDVLSRCVYQLRRHLLRAGGNDDFKRLLETLPKRGYRLTCRVTAVSPPGRSEPPRRRRRGAVVAVVFALLAVAVPMGLMLSRDGASADLEEPIGSVTIAVLPFIDLSEGHNQEYLADGLAEETLDRLSRLRGVRVIARSSSFAFKNVNVGVETIAKRLSASHLIEGSLRAVGNQVRVTVRLVEASSGSPVWSESYQRELSDVFALQSQIARSVAGTLEVQLAGTDPALLEPRPIDPRAEQHYLQGQYFYNRRGPGDAERAQRHFYRAVELEPGHARAWAGLAGVYNVLLADVGGIDPQEAMARFGQAAREAVAADSTLPRAHVRLSQYLAMTGDRAAADESLRSALALDPNDVLALAVSAGRAVHELRWDQAIRLQRRAVALDPVAIVNRHNLAAYLMQAGQLREAYREILILKELRPGPPFPNALPGKAGLLVAVLILLERHDEALAPLQRWPQGDERDRFLAMVYHAQGRVAESDALVERQSKPPALRELVRMAEVHAFRGDREAAFHWLSVTTDQIRADASLPPSDRQESLWELAMSPFLTPLHQDPRWQEWMAFLQSAGIS